MGPADPNIADYFRRWMEEDGFPLWSFWDHVKSWWTVRDVPNVLLLHFDHLKRDLEGEVRRVGDFLGCDIAPERWSAIVEHCTFEYMKRHAEKVAPLGAAFMQGGRGAFINKGVNGRWRDVLTDEDIARYETLARERLGDDCAEWLAGR